jgi:hypothetical protein
VSHAQHAASVDDFNDPADWSTCLTSETAVDVLEPLPEPVNPYRQAALTHFRVLLAVDAFMTESEDPRLAWISIAVTANLHSVHGRSPGEICSEMGVAEEDLERSVVQFRALAGIAADPRAILLRRQRSGNRLA